MPSRISNHKNICNVIMNFMNDIGNWETFMTNEIPKSYEKYGDHLIFYRPAFASKNWDAAGDDLWKLICKLYKGKAVAIGGRIQSDSFRTPQTRLVYGDSGIVNYKDNHVIYTWDIEKNMFCAGNVNERHRVATFDCRNEVIVDLFAGIGYFTLPYLVHAKAKLVHACEWNSHAVAALKRNLKINEISDRCHIYEGDNREVCPKKVGHRVNVGLIPSSEDYWQVACESLVDEGGILYIHQNVTSKFNSSSRCEICDSVMGTLNIDTTAHSHIPYECSKEDKLHVWNPLLGQSIKSKKLEWFIYGIHVSHSISSILHKLYTKSWKVSVREIFKVKSYAPHIDHLVYTVYCNS